MADQNVRISGETHKELIAYTQIKDLKIGKIADKLIKEGIEKLRLQDNVVLERNSKKLV